MNGVLRTRARLLAGSMILGPMCIVLGHLLNVDSSEAPARYVRDVSAHHAAFVAGSIIVSAGAFLTIAAMAGAMRLTPGRGGALVTAGAAVACAAAASLGAGTLMLGTVMGMLTPGHAALAVQVDQVGQGSSLGSLPFILAPGLMIGVLLVAVGLFRAGLVRRWVAVLLGVSVVPTLVAPAGGALGAVLHLPLGVALAALGVELWRSRPRDSSALPAGADLAQAQPA